MDAPNYISTNLVLLMHFDHHKRNVSTFRELVLGLL